MSVTKVVAAGKSKDQWIILDDVPGEPAARVRVHAVTNLGHGVVRLTIQKHPTLGTWRPQYHNLHSLRLAD